MKAEDHPAVDGERKSDEKAGGRSRRRRLLRVAPAVLVVALVGALVVSAAPLALAWSGVGRESYDAEAYATLSPVVVPAAAEDASGEQLPVEVVAAMAAEHPETGDDVPVNLAANGDDYDVYMVVGSDEGDQRADVIVLVLLPADGGAPLMVSLPRDLYLPNRCTQGLTRINANYNGCGDDVNGPTQLSGAVRDFTGLEVDHFVLFTMEGFATVIDELGGVEICVEHAVREVGRVELPAGCSIADSEAALGWVRSRQTQEYVDGRWRTMPGVNDLARNQRQQDLILSMLDRTAELDSPRRLAAVISSLSDAFTLDDRLGMTDAVDLVWDNRDVRPETVVRFTIPVRNHTTAGGAQVLLPTEPFAQVLAEARGS